MPILSPKKTVARSTKNTLEVHGFPKRGNGSKEKRSRPIGFKYRKLEHWFKPKSRPNHGLQRELRVVLVRCKIPGRNKAFSTEGRDSLNGSGMSPIEPSSFALDKIESGTSAFDSRGTAENVIDSGTIAQPKDEPLAILDEPMREKFEEFETFHGKNEDRCPVLSSAISLLPSDSQVAASQSQMEIISDDNHKDVSEGRKGLRTMLTRRADSNLIVDFEATLESSNILKDEKSDERCDVLYSTEMGLLTGSENQQQQHKDRSYPSCNIGTVKLEQELQGHVANLAVMETRSGEIQNGKSIPESNLTAQPITRKTFLTREVFTCDTCGMKFLQKNLMPKHMLLHLDTEPFVSCDIRGKDVNKKPDLARKLLKHKDVSSSLGKFRIDTMTRLQAGDKVTSFDIRVNDNLGQKEDGFQKFPKLFSCDTCRKNFKSKVTLREHIWKAHDGSKSCTSDKSLIKRNQKSHLLVDRRSKSFSCKMCDEKFKSRKCLKQHTARVHRDNPWTCEVCGKFFKLENSLDAHLKTVHLIGSYVLCEICGKACANKSALKRHSSSHSLEKPYSCDTCGKKFNLKRYLTLHLRIHEPREAFPCKICGKILKSDSSLKIHVGLHLGHRQFSCGVCGDRFAYKGRLQEHMKMHTGKELYPCNICGKEWLSREKFEDHMKSHTGEKPFACEICGKRFGRKRTRNFHMKSHEPRIECRVCNRRFKTEAFAKHKTTCKSENRRTCDICNKTYSSKSHLWRHKLTHKSKKRSKCDPCGAVFYEKRELRKHMAKHSGAWRFSCGICGQNSNQRNRFETHVKMHDSKQPYFCDICQTYFSIQRRLHSHIQMHHAENSHSTDEVCKNKQGRHIEGNDPTPPQFTQNMNIGVAIEGMSDHNIKDVCRGRKELRPTLMRRADSGWIVDFEATLEGSNILKNEKSDEKCDVLYSTEMGLLTGSENQQQQHKDRSYPSCNIDAEKLRQELEGHMTNLAGMETRPEEIQNGKSIPESNLTVQPITRELFLNRKVFTRDNCGMKFLQKNLMPKHMLLHLDTEPFVSCDDRGKDVREKSELAQNLLKPEDVFSTLGEVRTDTMTRPQTGDKVTSFEIRVNDNLGQKEDGFQKFFKLFSCDTCRKNFKSKVTLREHIWKAHDDSKSCTSDKTLIKRNLKSHLLVDGRNKPCSCKMCDEKFKSKICLKQHTARVHRGNPWTCGVCGKMFKLEYSLNAHLKTVHLIGSYVLCEICGKACASKSALEKHSTTHSMEKPFSCDTCGKTFNLKRYLTLHLRIHEPREAFPCKICGKILKSDSSLKIHVGLHMGQRQFSCGVCGDRFAYKGRLQEHMKMHTGKELYPCNICGKEWLSRDKLEDHMKSHTGEKPFACEICGKRFGRKGTRNLHMKSHVPQIECRVCNRRFKTEAFAKHKMTCTSENRRTCDICNKTYSSRMTLWIHKLTHKSEKRFKCDPCGASFHRKKELQWHMAKHSSAWRFSCGICGQNSNQRNRFETHVKKHDSKQPYFCDICQTYFAIQRRLQSHIQMHHAENSHSTDEVCRNKRGRQVKGNDTTRPQLAQNMGIGAAIEALDKFAAE